MTVSPPLLRCVQPGAALRQWCSLCLPRVTNQHAGTNDVWERENTGQNTLPTLLIATVLSWQLGIHFLCNKKQERTFATRFTTRSACSPGVSRLVWSLIDVHPKTESYQQLKFKNKQQQPNTHTQKTKQHQHTFKNNTPLQFFFPRPLRLHLDFHRKLLYLV